MAMAPHGFGLARHAPRHCPQACRQFVQRDGFDQVVVRAGIQPRDAAFDGFARGQDNDRQAAAIAAPALEQRHAVFARQAKIQHHGIVVHHFHGLVAFAAAGEPVDGIAQQAQAGFQAIADQWVVFNDEDSHLLPSRHFLSRHVRLRLPPRTR
ncbi:hypothetical protein D3C87_1274710 [compost metagenome]